MKYHLRDMLGTVQLDSNGFEFNIERFNIALMIAYAMSAEKNKAIYVCRGSSGTEMPSFTEVACVRACK